VGCCGRGVVGPLYTGLRTWKRQAQYNVESALARRVLLGAYRVREAIQTVRNPSITIGEFKAALGDQWEMRVGRDQRKEDAAVYARRWTAISDALAELDAAVLEADATWDVRVSPTTDPLRARISDLLKAIRLELDAFGSGQGRWEATKTDPGENFKVVYGVGRDPGSDPFYGRVQEAVAQIAAAVKPRLRP
jgi:hypothetical protein